MFRYQLIRGGKNMKKLALFIFMFVMVIGLVHSEESIYAIDGRKIFLSDDGTYKFVDYDEQVVIVLEKIGDDKSYDNADLVILTFRVENYGFGTIYNMDATVEAFDDRDLVMENYGLSSVDTTDWETIYIHKNSFERFDVKIKGKKEYLATVVLNKIDPENFNMRLLPEEVDINRLVTVKSEIPNVIFRK